jgi:hypothetical protein
MPLGTRRGVVVVASALLLSLSSVQGTQFSTAFTIAGSQFHQRDPEDAGEARVCIQNTGDHALPMTQLAIRVLAEKTADPEAPAAECKFVYAKLMPPVVQPGQYGEIVAKLTDRPTAAYRLWCEISADGGTVCRTPSLVEPSLWISYVGFSEDSRKVYVYLENQDGQPIEARLLRVGHLDTAGRTERIHVPVPAGDKGCLVGDLPASLSVGGFVHLVVAATVDGVESKVQTVVRAIRDLPIVPEFGGGDPALGLDASHPVLETMACPAHAHGTHEEAAATFLRDYAQRFAENPGQAIQIAVCRAEMPKAWFRFGGLPDVVALNSCLCPPSCYARNPQTWFSPFSCVGELAKKATEPGRFTAIIPTGPDVEDGSFLLRGLTSPEWRFLVYCAMASGAKGVSYRGRPNGDALSRDAFRQLNRELQRLKPLLLIGEPVEWATTEGAGYAARTLLCGDEAILVMVFDCRYLSRQRNGKFYTPSIPRAVTSVRVNVRIPVGETVQNVTTPFASLDRSVWRCREGVLSVTTDMVDSAQVYIASLQSQNPQLDTGQLQ